MKTPDRPALLDQAERDRFIQELSVNFGVVAPAGVGKTHSIVSRILAMARSRDAVEILPNLVVVTYTNRAAQEMQQRARAAILSEIGNLEVVSAFNRAFFGTIHSFCLRLLQSYGHYLGVPGRAQLLEDDTELWAQFSQLQRSGDLWNNDVAGALLRHVPVSAIFGLARDIDPRVRVTAGFGACPALNTAAVTNYSPVRKITAAGLERIARDQAMLARWMEGQHAGHEYLPLPKPSSSSEPFKQVWREALQPLRQWLGRAAMHLSVELAREYQKHRASAGFLTFADQVTLAADLLSDPAAARLIRREDFRIILDEAQDTDPEQFFVLLESAKDSASPGVNPRPGHFAMVGDHQQSIYGRRADLAVYRKLHEQLTQSDGGSEVKFSVTFRCAKKIVEFVNHSFPNLFNGEEGQVAFVPLDAKPGASAGQVVRLPIENMVARDDGKKAADAEKARHEARQVAEILRVQGLASLRARDWGQVAVLCPRKAWFGVFREALERAGIPCQLQSMREIAGDSPVYAWFCALIWTMAHPRDGYEVVGILREIFGLSDSDLADFADGREGVFQLIERNEDSGHVAERLNKLVTLRHALAVLPLRDAVWRLVTEVRLRKRLLALPLDMDRAGIERELDGLLVMASAGEEQGMSLRDFARRLKDGFYHPREADAPRRNAVQLLTCQKAKGLEWDAVIVPCFFRKIRQAPPRYPLCWRHAGGAEPQVLLGSDDADEEFKEVARLAERQELERLLYVTCTRARETLVLLDDRELFESESRSESTTSFGALLLRSDHANLSLWDELPTGLKVESGRESRLTPVQTELDLNAVSGQRKIINRDCARQRAEHFPRRVTPHALAKKALPEEPEIRLEQMEDRPDVDWQTPATQYGTWWHGLMEMIPWNESATSWPAVFDQAVLSSVDADRSRREWELFRLSTLAKKLNQPEWIFQVEMPFLWPAEPGQIVEGVMDLAAYDPSRKEWWVIDWKTNRLGERGMEELEEIYAAQIRAYLAALKEIFHCPVRGILYSTILGEYREISG